MTLPAAAVEIRAGHIRCIARAEDRNWCPEHQHPSPPDHCVACQRAWPCDVERLALAVEGDPSRPDEVLEILSRKASEAGPVPEAIRRDVAQLPRPQVGRPGPDPRR